MENHQNNVLLAQSTAVERVEFYRKTYAHVAGGVLLFILAAWFLLSIPVVVEFALSMTQGWR